jgi:hypothetical protein
MKKPIAKAIVVTMVFLWAISIFSRHYSDPSQFPAPTKIESAEDLRPIELKRICGDLK